MKKKSIMMLFVSSLLLGACGFSDGVKEGLEDGADNADSTEVVEETEETDKETEATDDESDKEIEAEEDVTREDEIERTIRNRAEDMSGYSGFRIDEIRVNENMGDEDSDTYIVLVDLTWETKTKPERADDMIDSVSQDIAAHLYEQGAEDIAEIAVFTRDEYNERDIKYSFEQTDSGFALTDQVTN